MGIKGVGGDPIDQGEPEVVEVDRVELSEEVIWKTRAAEAEEKLAACEARVSGLERELAEANEAVVSTQRGGACCGFGNGVFADGGDDQRDG